jgi:hypothetical protein
MVAGVMVSQATRPDPERSSIAARASREPV